MSSLERTLLWMIWGGIALLLLTPLVVTNSLFFPFITGKNFFFRIIVEVIFGFYVALAILNRDFRPKKSPLLLVLTLFFAVVTLAALFGVDPYHSFWSNFERMEGLITHLHLFALFLVLSHTLRGSKEWFYFMNFSVAVSLLVVPVAKYLEDHGFVGAISDLSGSTRPVMTFGNSIYLAVYMMFHLFIIAALFYKVRVWWARTLYALLFLFDFYIFFIAASRGAFVGFVAGVSLIAVLLPFFSVKRSYRFAALAVIAPLVISAGIVFRIAGSALQSWRLPRYRRSRLLGL